MVDKSLSRGLADRVLEEMSGLAHAYSRLGSKVFQQVPGKRYDIRAAADSLRAAGEACCLTQVVATHPKSRWVATCAFVPEVREGAGPHARELTFRTVRTFSYVDRVPLVAVEPALILTIHEHAIERMFQRLNVMDACEVREEIHDAVLLAPSLLAASRKAGRLQAVLPTRSGAFLCCVLEGSRLVAKTWIASAEEPNRHTAPVSAARDFLRRCGGEAGLGEALGALPINAPLPSLPVDPMFAENLRAIPWLGDVYEARHDPVGELWRRAREQQLAA